MDVFPQDPKYLSFGLEKTRTSRQGRSLPFDGMKLNFRMEAFTRDWSTMCPKAGFTYFERRLSFIMNKFNYKAFYDRVGAENGWNFSKVQCRTEGIELNFFNKVVEKTKGSELLLDIGTGGGEAALSIADRVLLLVGIDCSSAMITTAQKNLSKQKIENTRFLKMDASRLNFPDEFFDRVTCRHSDFNSGEVYRVLNQKGIFLTQQVSENDKLTIKKFFGRGQAYGSPQGTLRKKQFDALRRSGFKEIQSFEANVTEYYSRTEDLIFLLKHTPIVPHFGEVDGDFKLLDAFIHAHMTEKGIVTNASRFMLVASK